MSRQDLKKELLKLVEAKSRIRKQNLCLEFFKSFYDWQLEFCKSTADFYECCLMAANQIGKTRVGTTIDAFHLTGDYPEDYPGHKFDFAPKCWGLEISMEKTRDLLQTALFGEYTPENGFAGGLIPKDRIHSKESVQGTANAMRTVRVKHSSGGVSVIQFWSYAQGQHKFMGDKVDWIHVDEEPRDQRVRGQLITRVLNGNKGKGGKIMYTFTPENGRTSLVIKFMDNPAKSQFFMQKGWVDAPHMTQEKQDRAMEQYPDHERDMRSKGDPMLGHGRIYDLSDDFITCDPFPIRDFFKTICALDIGDNHPQAIVKIVYDPEADIIYVVNSWKSSLASANDAWGATKSWSANIPLAWPHDGNKGETARSDAVQIIKHYSNAGFKTLYTHATWPDSVDVNGKSVGGGNAVEPGIYNIIDRARKGKFKVFRGQIEFFEEWRQYHRDESGKIVKLRDDILCAVRYAVMMLRFAVYHSEGNTTNVKKEYIPKPRGVIGRKVRR